MKRRVFVEFSDDTNKYQLLSINQSINGGDIYCTVPGKKFAQWHGFVRAQNGQTIILKTKTKFEDNAHLSVHASGQLHIKNQTTHSYSPSLRGNKLADLGGQELSVRHLFTVFPTVPNHLPSSPASIERGDMIMRNVGVQKPFALVCFAVPKGVLKISLRFSFHVDDIETVPPDAGAYISELSHHQIIAIAYRAKQMSDWPKDAIILYGDGYIAPFVMGYKGKNIIVELREPKYSLDDKKNLIITLPTKHIDEGDVTKESI